MSISISINIYIYIYIYTHIYMYIYIYMLYIHIYIYISISISISISTRRSRARAGSARKVRERRSAPKWGRHSTISFYSLVKTLLVRCPSVQWRPDGLTIHANRWFLGARFLGAPPISLIGRARLGKPRTSATCRLTSPVSSTSKAPCDT